MKLIDFIQSWRDCAFCLVHPPKTNWVFQLSSQLATVKIIFPFFVKFFETIDLLNNKTLCQDHTVVNSVMKIWLKILGDFGTKICYFIRENIAENGPLVFRTVLYSKYDEKQGNHERKTLR